MLEHDTSFAGGLVALPAQYAEQDLCNCRTSVHTPVCLSRPVRPLHAAVAGLLLWAQSGRRCQSIAAQQTAAATLQQANASSVTL